MNTVFESFLFVRTKWQSLILSFPIWNMELVVFRKVSCSWLWRTVFRIWCVICSFYSRSFWRKMVLWYYSMLLILLCQLNMKSPAVQKYTLCSFVCVSVIQKTNNRSHWNNSINLISHIIFWMKLNCSWYMNMTAVAYWMWLALLYATRWLTPPITLTTKIFYYAQHTR